MSRFYLFTTYVAVVALIFQLGLVLTVKADCYAYDGLLALESKYYVGNELLPCGNNTNNCCLPGEKCGTNLLCTRAGGGVTRQYCADREWNKCSMMCIDTNPNAGIDLTDCGRNIYCCGKNNDCCKSGRVFHVDPSNGFIRSAGNVEASVSAAASPTWWSIDSSRILAGSTTSSVSSTPTVSSFTMTTPTSASASASISTSTTTSTATAGSTSSGGLSAGAGAGIGVGGVFGIAAIILGIYLVRKRKKKQEAQPQTEQTYTYPYQDYQDYQGQYQADIYSQKVPVEMSEHEAPRELAAPHTRHELK